VYIAKVGFAGPRIVGALEITPDLDARADKAALLRALPDPDVSGHRHDRLVDARLQQMRCPENHVPPTDAGLAGAKANGLFFDCDRLLYRPHKLLALCKIV